MFSWLPYYIRLVCAALFIRRWLICVYPSINYSVTINTQRHCLSLPIEAPAKGAGEALAASVEPVASGGVATSRTIVCCNQCTILNICFSLLHPCKGRGCWMIRIYIIWKLTYFSHSFSKNKKSKKRTFVYIAEIFLLEITLFWKIESLKITLLFTYRKYSIWKLYIYI